MWSSNITEKSIRDGIITKLTKMMTKGAKYVVINWFNRDTLIKLLRANLKGSIREIALIGVSTTRQKMNKARNRPIRLNTATV
jgi:hypothetical protein